MKEILNAPLGAAINQNRSKSKIGMTKRQSLPRHFLGFKKL
jgi:hypothetical protein